MGLLDRSQWKLMILGTLIWILYSGLELVGSGRYAGGILHDIVFETPGSEPRLVAFAYISISYLAIIFVIAKLWKPNKDEQNNF